MIYEVRTFTLKPGTVDEYEARFEKMNPLLERHFKLVAFWHTEIGPLNQVVFVWEFDDLNHRATVCEAASKDRDLKQHLQQQPTARELVVGRQAEIVIPAPFMRPLGSRSYGNGNVYEMRTYTYEYSHIAEVLNAWAAWIPHREEYSPLAACWETDLGVLNMLTQVWVYKDLNERARIRAESRQGPHWPPKTPVRPVREENKMLMPASFSPVR